MVHAPSARASRIAALSAGPAAVVLAGVLVWQGSTAAFTATTTNAGNSWSTGRVALTDDDQGAAAFSVTDLVPGQRGQKCIVVTSGSTVPGEVRTYTEHLATSSTVLNDHLTLQLERGTGGSFDSCDGFTSAGSTTPLSLNGIVGAHNDYASGVMPWETQGVDGESASYRITWAFGTEGMSQAEIDALQGAQTSIDIVWELQNDDATV
jgi:hypothetical protein